MATAPTAQTGAANAGRRHKGSSLTSWLKKSSGSDASDTKKLASPAEEIKMVFLRQLKLSSFELDGKQYHSVFTGEQIVDIILDHFKLPDRKLATNVASRLIDCSLYTHVSGMCAEGDRQGAVVDSTAEIYTLTPEAHGILKTLNKGEALSRAKTQTRRRYNDLRSHLHPRTGSSSASHASSRTSIHRTRSTVSTASRDTTATDHAPHTPSMPLAPLDVRRSVAESIGSGIGKRWSADSPAETLVAHGPPTAEEAETQSTGDNRRSDGTDTPTIREIDIPTGGLDGLLSTWSRSPELSADSESAGDAGSSADVELTPASPLSDTSNQPLVLDDDDDGLNEHDRESTASLVDDSATADIAGSQNRDSLGADESTAGSDSLQRMSQVSSIDWAEATAQQRWGRESMLSQRRRGSSIFSDGTASRRLSLPSVFRAAGDDCAATEAHSCDEEWLADLAFAPRRSMGESQFGLRSRHSLASTHGGVACATGEPADVWAQRRARRHSTGTQMLALSECLTPATQRSSIGGTTAETVGTQASRSSACLGGDAYFGAGGDACFGAGGDACFGAGGNDSSIGISAASLALSSIPHFPRPRTPRSAPAQSDGSAAADNDDDEARALRRLSKGATLRRRHVTPDALESQERAAVAVAQRASSATLGSSSCEDAMASRRVSCNMQLQLWRDTVPPSLVQELAPETVARQEAIFEIISTEHGYLRDLELIDTLFVGPLLAGTDALPAAQAQAFVEMLFYNYRALVANSAALCAQLRQRQAQAAVVDGVGDIFDAWAGDLGAFVEYAVHVPDAQCGLEAELLRSEAMARFLQRAEEAPAARRLPVQSFIGRPATRLARYPLLLDAIARRTRGADAERLRSAAGKVRGALAEIDRRTGDAAARLRIRQISQRLRLVRGARESLALDSPARRLEREGVFQADGGRHVLVFLFDNSLIMAVEEKVPHARGISRYAADDRIIPISMLDAVAPQAESRARAGLREALRLPNQDPGTRPPLAFVHIGCAALSRTLLAPSEAERDAWVRAVRRRVSVPQTLVEAHTEARVLSDRDFAHVRAPLCSAPFVSLLSGCQMVLYGNRDGMHMGIYGVPTSVVRVSHAPGVAKIHILKRFNLVLALSESTLLCFPLSEIEKAAAQAGGVAGAKLASSVGFFDVGAYMGRPLVVLMKPRGGRSHFKCLQPLANAAEDESGDSDGAELRALRAVYAGPDASLRLAGEFVVGGRARRVHFLRRKLCIVGARSFDVVDVQQGRVLRSLPDPLDDDFSFLSAAAQALAICKVGRDFLLCYDACAFFIDNFGRRARPDVFVRWEMRPHAITFRHPYVVAVNPRFLEIRHIETGVLLSIIRVPRATCLNPDSRSTVLHLAIGPEPVGVPTPDDESRGDAGADASAVPVPARPTSVALLKSAQILGSGAQPQARYVVPGLAGTTGRREFPEAVPGHYRVIEVRLPPLKTSAKPGLD